MHPPLSQGGIIRDVISGTLITMFLFGIALLQPVIGLFSLLCTPLPALYYRFKLGRGSGLLIPLAAAAGMGILLGGMSLDILLLAKLALVGFFLSEFIRRELPLEKTVLFTSGAATACGFGGLLFYSYLAGTGVMEILGGHFQRMLEAWITLYQEMGIPQENIDPIARHRQEIQALLVGITPGMTLTAMLLVTWSSLLIGRVVFKAKGAAAWDFGPLNRWRAPDMLIWGVIASALLSFFPDQGLKLLGINGLIFFLTVYFLQGIAIVSFYLQQKGAPLPLKVLAYGLLALQPALALIVTGLGVFDMWLDFRKIGNPGSR